VSPDGRLAALLVDDNGSERFKLRILYIASGKD
jgi:oligopeptidase B